MKKDQIEKLLEVYTLADIIEFNDLDEADLLLLLYKGGHIVFPEVKPLD